MKHYIALDRSGSMSGRWGSVLASIQEYVNGMSDDDHLTVLAFDSVDMEYICKNASKADYEINESIQPRSATPLYDAIKRSFREMADEDRGVVIVITDGYENASETRLKEIQKIIDDGEKNQIECIFIGASLQDLRDSKDMGIDRNKSVTVLDGNYSNAMTDLAFKTRAYSSGADGQALNFSDAERTEYGSE